MLLSELKTEGTYVALVPTADTERQLKAWAVENGIPLVGNLHVTLLYSRKPVKVVPSTEEVIAWSDGFDVFDGHLVLRLGSNVLHKRHNEFISQGGTHDFDEYRPHMTLVKGGFNPVNVTAITFDIVLHGEYSEPLDP